LEPIPVPTPQWTELCGQRGSEDLDALVQKVAGETGMSPALLSAVVTHESTCNPKALGSSGEIGLTQIHPKVWSETLVKEGFIRQSQDLWDPETNLRCAAFILQGHLQRTNGNIWKTLRKYNGSGPMARAYADTVTPIYDHLSKEY